MKRLAKWLLSILLILLLLAGGVAGLGWWLSGNFSGERLARMQAFPQYKAGAFFNEERQAPQDLGLNYLKRQFFGDEQRVPPGALPVMAIKPESLRAKPESGLRAAWLGHSSVLIEIDGQRLLMDPVLSARASPFQFFGPERFHPSPIPLARLNGIDAVLISHDHYDHLDEATIRHLARQGTKFFVPLGIGAHLESWGVSAGQMHELAWWESVEFGDLMITSTPNRHYSGRGFFDYKGTLWSSWAVVGPDHRLFYSGDSGYSKLFRNIGARFGPFDLGIIKIGSYGPGASWTDIHMVPEYAIRVHQDIGGKKLLPVHWATFNLALHDWDEPIKRVLKAAEAENVNILTPKLGEVVDLDRPFTNTPWWESVR